MADLSQKVNGRFSLWSGWVASAPPNTQRTYRGGSLRYTSRKRYVPPRSGERNHLTMPGSWRQASSRRFFFSPPMLIVEEASYLRPV
jgi:hypothetical protein